MPVTMEDELLGNCERCNESHLVILAQSMSLYQVLFKVKVINRVYHYSILLLLIYFTYRPLTVHI